MQNSENFSAPKKATSGRSAYSPALYQIQSAIAKLLVSFRCQVKIREGQARETAWCYGCSIHTHPSPTYFPLFLLHLHSSLCTPSVLPHLSHIPIHFLSALSTSTPLPVPNHIPFHVLPHHLLPSFLPLFTFTALHLHFPSAPIYFLHFSFSHL